MNFEALDKGHLTQVRAMELQSQRKYMDSSSCLGFLLFSFAVACCLTDLTAASSIRFQIRQARSSDATASEAKVLSLEDDDLSRRWPLGVVPYLVQSDVDEKVKAAITEAVNDFAQSTCVRFVPRTTQENYVQFIPSSKCHSTIGRVGGVQTIEMAPGCGDRGTASHELMHVLGFGHEHNRPDRDSHISVQWDNIKQGEEDNFKKEAFSHSMVDRYDYSSVMHYARDAFSRDPGKLDTIMTKDSIPSAMPGDAWNIRSILTGKPVGVYYAESMGQRLRLSGNDLSKINKFYMCDGSKSLADEVRPSCIYGDTKYYDGDTWSSGAYVMQCFAWLNGTKIVRPVACLVDGQRRENAERWQISGAFVMQCFIHKHWNSVGAAETRPVGCITNDGREVDIGQTWTVAAGSGPFSFVNQCKRTDNGVTATPISCRYRSASGEGGDVPVGCYRQYGRLYVYCVGSGGQFNMGASLSTPSNANSC